MKFRIGLVVGAVAFGLALVNPAVSVHPTRSVAAAAADPYPRTVKTVCDARALKNPYRAGKKERWRMIIIENSTDLPRVRLSYVKQRKTAEGRLEDGPQVPSQALLPRQAAQPAVPDDRAPARTG